MRPLAFYNDNDAACYATLLEQMCYDVIAPGIVDRRSIKELTADDVAGFAQVHWFAGGGGWSIAARLAGWEDSRPLWTASCPCQPFSGAGKGAGFADERHLWPDLFRIVRAGRPAVLVGEQVASAPGYAWLDRVFADLEGEGYACRAVDIPACAVDAPHIRNRIYWCAVAQPCGARVGHYAGPSCGEERRAVDAGAARLRQDDGPTLSGRPAAGNGSDVGVADTGSRGRDERGALRRERTTALADHPRSFWRDSEWIACHDKKARRSKPGIRLLVDGLPGRVDQWRIAGNGIVVPLAAQVLAALKETLDEGVI